MKAIVQNHYGLPDVLQLKEIEKPTPGKNQVLVRVMAATVNRTDCANLTAKPYIMRLTNGLLKPKKTIPGTDFSGIVESVGEEVQNFKSGQKVFGFDDRGLLSHAEYLCVDEERMEQMAENQSFEQAAASIEGFHYAYNFINKVDLNKDHHVMINGATGAIGSAALQLVKSYGCRIAATCRKENTEQVKNMGANVVIDYLQQDFTKQAERFDFVLDTVGKSSFGKCKPILKPGGIYISSELGWMAQNLFFAMLGKVMGSKTVKFPLPVDIKASLLLVKKLSEENKFIPLIDRTYPLEKVAEAFTYVLKGEKAGNVVIKTEH